MKAKKYLSQVKDLDIRTNNKIEQLERLKSQVYKITYDVGEEKVIKSKKKSPMENSIIKFLSVEEEVNNLVNRLIDLKSDIGEKIEKLKEEDYKLLLELRYLNYNDWDEVSEKMNYSKSYVYKQHYNAIKAFERVYNLKS